MTASENTTISKVQTIIASDMASEKTLVPQTKALVLLSGGQDSTTCLFWALQKYGQGNVSAIGYNYGQRHNAELECAQRICDRYNVSFTIIHLPALGEMTNNALTNPDIVVDTSKPANSPPNTLVEGRNLLFLNYAAILAKSIDAKILVTGVCETDFSGYPDCRDIFVKSTNVTLNLAFDYSFVIETPLMWLTKSETWALADRLGVLEIIQNETLTCYNSIKGKGCGNCPACDLRQKGYEEFLCTK